MKSSEFIALDNRYAAHNYDPLPIVATSAEGVWITDVEGNVYLDMLAGYSALNFGHQNPKIVSAAMEQLQRLALTSRMVHNDQLGLFCRDLAELTGLDVVLPMNTGAEAVETALKLVRRWGYDNLGILPDRASIIVMDENFHGRTISIVSFSSDPTARNGFGPYTPGFFSVPFGSAAAIADAITSDTVAVLLEPIQGEAGVIIPPNGYLADVRRVCDDAGILMVADEIQSGLCRTGEVFACDHEGVQPDVYILGKALGGGLLPLSAVVAMRHVMDVIGPGEHGSTFGGNPLAVAVGRRVLELIATQDYSEAARRLGAIFGEELERIARETGAISQVRCRGLWAGIDITIPGVSGHDVSIELLKRRVIAKDTQGETIRFAPPLIISEKDLRWGIQQIEDALVFLGRT